MSLATGSYKRLIQLLEKWPVDKNKAGRDLAEHLKRYIDKAYKENAFETDLKFWDKQYISMKILLNNEHKNKYKRSLISSVTGLTAEQCNTALSNEFMTELAEEDTSHVKKYFPFLKK